MSKEYLGKKVLLLDGYGRQIPSILHQLHQLGCVVTTVNESKLDVGYSSRYPKKRIVQKGIRENKEVYREIIEKELSAGNYDIVFPMLEKSTEILHQLDKEGKLYGAKMIAAPDEAFRKAYDKQETMRICTENGIACPATKMDSETLEEYLNRVSFPLACKPRKGSGSAGFKKVSSKEELMGYINDGTIKLEEYVIQEYIEDIKYMVNCYVMMDNEHKPVFKVVVKTYRWYPINGGPGCFSRTVDEPEAAESAARLLEKMGWSGMAQVSFMFDGKDSLPKVGEINGRISAGIKTCEYAGCTPVKYMLQRAYGERIVPMEKPVPAGLGLRYFHTDIMWFLKNPKRFSSKPSWFDFSKSKDYIFSWGDPIPFFTYAIEHVLTYKKDMKKREH